MKLLKEILLTLGAIVLAIVNIVAVLIGGAFVVLVACIGGIFSGWNSGMGGE